MDQPRPFALRLLSPLPMAEVEARCRSLLADEGFGVLTEIDMAATLKAKLGVDEAPCLILGACNPTFAREAMGREPAVGVLLPCNVVIRDLGSHREVWAMDPAFMGTVAPTLADLGQAVGERIRRVLERLEAGA